MGVHHGSEAGKGSRIAEIWSLLALYFHLILIILIYVVVSLLLLLQRAAAYSERRENPTLIRVSCVLRQFAKEVFITSNCH